ncbi:MAG: PLP-dependent lyase/thiolase [bacterium]|nr:PLP-dependent lyase/thiolase [bacterium]
MDINNVTPTEEMPNLASKYALKGLFFKREDKHPLGSHKGRSLPHMIDSAIISTPEGQKISFAISSSGNAGIASAKYISELNKTRDLDQKINLEIFVGKNIESEKKNILMNTEKSDQENIKVTESVRPLQSLLEKEKMGDEKAGVYSLRQSTNPLALVGYSNLAKEISKVPNLSAVFIAVSSGTSALGIANEFNNLGNKAEIHIVQTVSCHPIAKEFDKDFSQNISEKTFEKSEAKAIVDKVAFRKDDLIKAVKRSGGSGWIPNEKQIKEARELLSKELDTEVNANMALSFAGLLKAISSGKEWTGNILCIISGR